MSLHVQGIAIKGLYYNACVKQRLWHLATEGTAFDVAMKNKRR